SLQLRRGRWIMAENAEPEDMHLIYGVCSELSRIALYGKRYIICIHPSQFWNASTSNDLEKLLPKRPETELQLAGTKNDI
ncbi:hypothetical protein CEXT_514941, partial [Caerostris extrusa]